MYCNTIVQHAQSLTGTYVSHISHTRLTYVSHLTHIAHDVVHKPYECTCANTLQPEVEYQERWNWRAVPPIECSRNNPEGVQHRQACALEVCAGESSRRGPGAGGRRGARCQRNLCERTVQADICGVAKVHQLGDQPFPGKSFECGHPFVRPPQVPTDLERLYPNMSQLPRPPGPPLPRLLFCTSSREAGF